MALRDVTSLLNSRDAMLHRNVAPAARAYSELKRRILTCRVAPGERVDEKGLSKEFGVPLGVFREACQHLARERLLCVAKPRSFTVSGLTVREIHEVCELRRIVESKSAALAAERVRPEQAARLLVLAELNYHPGERHTYERYLKSNVAFHQQLARTTGNAWLEATVVSVLDQVNRPLYLGLDLGLDPDEATAEHLRVVDAVRGKRPALAYRLMWNQLSAAEKRMVAAFGDSGYA